MKRSCAVLILFCLGASLLPAQMSPEQRVQDLTSLASLYAKRYAPYEWKKQLSGFDLYDIRPWIARVRDAKDDLEYYEIAAEYVASLNDVHSSYRVPSTFTTDLGFVLDLYDGKPLIESINRSLLPSRQFPFQVGDEVVSVDGKSAEQLIAEFSKLRQRGNPLSTRRSAADLISYRPQSMIPRAVEVGDTATVVIRRASGAEETYTIPWTKSGQPILQVGPVPNLPFSAKQAQAVAAEEVPAVLRPLMEMRQWSVSADDHLLAGYGVDERTGEDASRRWLLGWGSRNPFFLAGLPSDFVRRRGGIGDFHFSGTYESQGKRIGYLRIPSFAPGNIPIALQELDNEIAFFQQNTDGLVVDVTRNTGGNCYMLDVARRLMNSSFYFFGEEIRPTIDRINSFQAMVESAERSRADQWIIDAYRSYLDAMRQAYREGRSRTDAIPACNAYPYSVPPSFENNPLANAYKKPVIFLIDEFSTSAADIFPSMMQDNQRGPLVGTRTNGAGGSISVWPAGFYSEASSSNTNSLVVRKAPVTVQGYPTSSYVENIGAQADIALDAMTRENLMNSFRPYVQGFTQILVDRLQANPE